MRVPTSSGKREIHTIVSHRLGVEPGGAAACALRPGPPALGPGAWGRQGPRTHSRACLFSVYGLHFFYPPEAPPHIFLKADKASHSKPRWGRWGGGGKCRSPRSLVARPLRAAFLMVSIRPLRVGSSRPDDELAQLAIDPPEATHRGIQIHSARVPHKRRKGAVRQ